MQLLEQLDKGKALDISGIPDKYAHRKVKEVFENISLLRRKSNGTYIQRSAGGSALALVAPILDESKESLEKVYRLGMDIDGKGDESLERRSEQEPQRDNSAMANIENPVENHEERQVKKSYGPTMPTTIELKKAEEMMEQQNIADKDPLLGPVPPEILEDLQGMCIIISIIIRRASAHLTHYLEFLLTQIQMMLSWLRWVES